mmetsp:Transcript_65856/g.184119  ORF Transcript_65856/g.184119 Transcript_65856/m.184119 type:complete len:116 (-) Transcript_65856:57-404(-)
MEACIEGANFKGATMSQVRLDRARGVDALLACADLSKASLREAELDNVDLTKANLRNADLSDASLRDATLAQAILSHTTWRKADLRGTGLTAVFLRKHSDDNLAEALFDGPLPAW